MSELVVTSYSVFNLMPDGPWLYDKKYQSPEIDAELEEFRRWKQMRAEEKEKPEVDPLLPPTRLIEVE